MADQVTDPSAAGWKRDPSGRYAGRYWDGSVWTEHVVSQDRVRSTDPLVAEAVRPEPAAAPAPVPRHVLPPPSGPAPAGGWRAWPLWARVGLPLAIVIAVVIVLAQTGKDGSAGTTTAPPASKPFAIGATAPTDQFDVTVYGYKDPQPPGQFLQPSAGTHYVSVDVQLANRGSAQQNFSSLLQIHLLDGSNRQYDPTFGEVTPPAPDGEIPPDQAIRGLALFEIPNGVTGLRVRVQGSLTAGGVYFALS